MNHQAVCVQQIKQKDSHTFSIVWSDGIEQNFRLSALQKRCPCASCIDEKTGRQLLDTKTVQEEVQAFFIRSVGRYALQIQFTSGCSAGIYQFDMLRQFDQKKDES
jgi:DUF971 family protein